MLGHIGRFVDCFVDGISHSLVDVTGCVRTFKFLFIGMHSCSLCFNVESRQAALAAKAYVSGVIWTTAMPRFLMPNAEAAASDMSRSRPGVNGPRSVTVTKTLLFVRKQYSSRRVPRG